MVSKFIVAPIIILLILSLVSIFGLGTNATLGTSNIGLGLTPSQACTTKYYDSSGVAKVYANGTAVNEGGTIGRESVLFPIPFVTYNNAVWLNTSAINGHYSKYPQYYLYTDTSGSSQLNFDTAISVAGYMGYNANPNVNGGVSVSPTTDIVAMLVVISALLDVGAVIGLHFLGSGESDSTIAMILKFTGFMAIWGIFSGLSYNLLSMIPLYIGLWFYFAITLLFVVGLVDTIGFPSK